MNIRQLKRINKNYQSLGDKSHVVIAKWWFKKANRKFRNILVNSVITWYGFKPIYRHNYLIKFKGQKPKYRKLRVNKCQK